MKYAKIVNDTPSQSYRSWVQLESDAEKFLSLLATYNELVIISDDIPDRKNVIFFDTKLEVE